MIHVMCLSIQVKEAEIGRSMVLFNGFAKPCNLLNQALVPPLFRYNLTLYISSNYKKIDYLSPQGQHYNKTDFIYNPIVRTSGIFEVVVKFALPHKIW
jgi:hypothetical protein